MSFKGYKLTFQFNAAHSNIENKAENLHFHTFSIVLYLNSGVGEDSFGDIEKSVRSWLAPYEDVYLPETDLFRDRSTTIENIANTFYDLWRPKVAELGFDLVRLDIFENPIRTYSVSDRLLDADVNELEAFPYSFSEGITYDEKIKENFQKERDFAKTNVSDKEEKESEVEREALYEAVHDRGEVKELVITEITEDGEKVIREKMIPEIDVEELQNKSIETSKKKFPLECICIGVAAVLTAVLMYVLYHYGVYPSGLDSYSHLYRGDLLKWNVQHGNWYPLYDPYWFNGAQTMRYFGPIPIYLLAAIEMITGGDIYMAYIGFAGLSFLLCCIGFIRLGYRENKVTLGLLTGMIFFFMPVNLCVLFDDGSIPRMFAVALLPALICAVNDMLKKGGKVNVLRVSLYGLLISLSHAGTAFMLIFVLMIYLLIYKAANRREKGMAKVFFAFISGILICGLWLVPSFFGNGALNINARFMSRFFQSAFTSLNPAVLWNGGKGFYFGLSIFVLCIIGLALGTKETIPGFATALIVFSLTTMSAYEILSRLPFSAFMWMTRFAPVAVAFALYSFLSWKGLKKYIMALICVCLIVDAYPTFRYVYDGELNIANAYDRDEKKADKLLITEAKENTSQRMAILDFDSYGAFAPYYVAGNGKRVKTLYGSSWENSAIKDDLSMLNTAYNYGRYPYVFDRALEMGTDTILVPIKCLNGGEGDVNAVMDAAIKTGYVLVAKTEDSLLFSMDTPEEFGVITDYKRIAIGHAAGMITWAYPSFEKGESENLSDYDFKKLETYDTIYLSDFVYDDKDQAEKLLNDLADKGVKIFIDMNKIPKNPKTNVYEFLGVSTQTFMYSEAFPVIYYGGLAYKCQPFPDEYYEWKGNYLIGLKDLIAYGGVDQKRLPLAGTNGNDNIVFIGYNFPYFAIETSDPSALTILNGILGVEMSEIPEREIVPIDIKYGNKEITVTSEYGNVNTSIADIKDVFSSDDGYDTADDMIIVGKGVTRIKMHYPRAFLGLLVSLAGLIMLAAMIKSQNDRQNRKLL